jgi:hypothetical protein
MGDDTYDGLATLVDGCWRSNRSAAFFDRDQWLLMST